MVAADRDLAYAHRSAAGLLRGLLRAAEGAGLTLQLEAGRVMNDPAVVPEMASAGERRGG